MSSHLLKLHLYLVLFLSASTLFGQSDFNIRIEQVDNPYYGAENYTEGLIIVEYTPGDSAMFLSMGAQSSDFTGPFDIIVSNLYLPSFKEVDTNRYTVTTEYNLFNLGIEDSTEKMATPIELIVYIHLLSSTGLYPFDPTTYFGPTYVTLIKSTYDAIGALLGPTIVSAPAPVVSTPETTDDPIVDSLRRKKVPNFDLDNASYPGSPTGYAGDKNACVPTACANSMQWLQNQGKISFTDTNLSKNHYSKLYALSREMNRDYQKGVTPEPMIKGKLNFIEKNDLPLSVKFQTKYVDTNVVSSSKSSTAQNFNRDGKPWPDWNFLKQMLKDGEDVEMNYHWQDTAGNWHGHSVNVIGFQEFASGKKTITFSHDRKQGRRNRAFGDDDIGTYIETHSINIDDEGAMRFGHDNSKRVFLVAAESPRPREGESTALFLNEFFGILGNKNPLISSTNEFIEVGIGSNANELELYDIHFYNSDGEVYSSLNFNDFSIASLADSIQLYTYTFQNDHFPNTQGGLAMSYSGTLIPGQFFSYGGEIIAKEGVAASLSSINIGDLVADNSIGLSGSGSNYTDFTFAYSPNPSPGILNDGQTIVTYVENNFDYEPKFYSLKQNYPNPFNPSTIIEYSVPSSEYVILNVYDLIGNEVATLVDAVKEAGNYRVNFNASYLSSGVYFYRLTSGNFSSVKKLIFIK